eukprot:UN06572
MQDDVHRRIRNKLWLYERGEIDVKPSEFSSLMHKFKNQIKAESNNNKSVANFRNYVSYYEKRFIQRYNNGPLVEDKNKNSVRKLVCYIGSCLDGIGFHYRNGSVQNWGGKGGKRMQYNLTENDYLKRIEFWKSKGRAAKNQNIMGYGIRFTTTGGRKFEALGKHCYNCFKNPHPPDYAFNARPSHAIQSIQYIHNNIKNITEHFVSYPLGSWLLNAKRHNYVPSLGLLHVENVGCKINILMGETYKIDRNNNICIENLADLNSLKYVGRGGGHKIHGKIIESEIGKTDIISQNSSQTIQSSRKSQKSPYSLYKRKSDMYSQRSN